MSWLAVWALLAITYAGLSILFAFLFHGTFRFTAELLCQLAVVPALQLGLLALVRAVRQATPPKPPS